MKKKDKSLLISILAVFAILIILFITSNIQFIKPAYLAAEVNGQPIFASEIDRQYNALPQDLKNKINKSMILQNSIDILLLKQEAEARGLILTDEQFNSMLEDALMQSNITKTQLEDRLKKQGMEIEDVKTQFLIKILLNGLLANVTENKKQETVQNFISSLRSKAEIKIYMT